MGFNKDQLLIIEKASTDHIDKCIEILNNSHLFNDDNTKNIEDYLCSVNANSMRIADVIYNAERFFGLIIKFHRPLPWNIEKSSTIKVLKSGKINFDGCNSALEVNELYYWLQEFFAIHKDEIIFDPENEEDITDTSSDGGEGIYV